MTQQSVKPNCVRSPIVSVAIDRADIALIIDALLQAEMTLPLIDERHKTMRVIDSLRGRQLDLANSLEDLLAENSSEFFRLGRNARHDGDHWRSLHLVARAQEFFRATIYSNSANLRGSIRSIGSRYRSAPDTSSEWPTALTAKTRCWDLHGTVPCMPNSGRQSKPCLSGSTSIPTFCTIRRVDWWLLLYLASIHVLTPWQHSSRLLCCAWVFDLLT
jgi:hypothetical protein